MTDNWRSFGPSASWYSLAVSADGMYQLAGTWPGSLYLSTDSGNSLEITYPSSTVYWSSVGMSQSGKYQVAGTSDGTIFTTSLFGLQGQWNSQKPAKSYLYFIVISGNGQYLGLTSGDIYISSDFGTTWINKATQFSTHAWIGISTSSDGKIWNSCSNPTPTPLIISYDYGNTWVPTGPAKSWGYCAMSSTSQYQSCLPGVVDYIYISGDIGATWNSALSDLMNWHYVAISSSGQYQIANNLGAYLYLSSNFGVSWIPTGPSVSGQWSGLAIGSDGQSQQSACVSCGLIYTNFPSNPPTISPSDFPSNEPTFNPSSLPTYLATSDPTFDPTNTPSLAPTYLFFKYSCIWN